MRLYDLGAISRYRLHHRGLNNTYKVESGHDDTHFLRIYGGQLALDHGENLTNLDFEVFD